MQNMLLDRFRVYLKDKLEDLNSLMMELILVLLFLTLIAAISLFITMTL